MRKAIVLKNITKYKNKNLILKNINLELEYGKIYGFRGKNGCGKSTLFKLICGFNKPTAGSILIDDKELHKDIDYISNSGVLIETPDFINDLTASENLYDIWKLNEKEGENNIDIILKKVGLFNSKDIKYKRFSLGMKQRLRIAQTLISNPKILILDEATNGLDKDGVALVKDILVEYKNKGTAILLTNHIDENLDDICDTVYTIENNSIKL